MPKVFVVPTFIGIAMIVSAIVTVIYWPKHEEFKNPKIIVGFKLDAPGDDGKYDIGDTCLDFFDVGGEYGPLHAEITKHMNERVSETKEGDDRWRAKASWEKRVLRFCVSGSEKDRNRILSGIRKIVSKQESKP